MVSNREKAKKLLQSFRLASERFFDDFYARAERAGRFPSPQEALIELGPIKLETEEEWPQQPPGCPGIPAEVFDLVAPRFFQEVYRGACEAYYRHTPGVEIKKGKPGRPRNDALADEAARLKRAGLSYAQIAGRLNRLHGKGTTTRENVRGLLKSRRLKARKVPPDKTRS